MQSAITTASISYHLQKCSEIEEDFAEFITNLDRIYTAKKDLILNWALHLEALHNLGHYKAPVTTICYYICNRLQARGFEHADSWVRKVLPQKYKDQLQAQRALKPNGGINPAGAQQEVKKEEEEEQQEQEQKQKQEQYDSAGDNDNAGLYVEDTQGQYSNINNYNNNNNNTNNNNKPVELMTDDELRTFVEDKIQQIKEHKRQHTILKQQTELLQTVCKNRGIAILDLEEKNIIKTPCNPGPSASYQAMCNLAEVVDKLCDKIYKFKPVEGDDILSREITKLVFILKPYADEKWAKSLQGWFKVQIDHLTYGKHAASSINYSTTLDGEKRMLTREQIGDKLDELVEIAAFLIDEQPAKTDRERIKQFKKAIDFIQSFFAARAIENTWHQHFEKSTSTRRYNVNPKLSNLS